MDKLVYKSKMVLTIERNVMATPFHEKKLIYVFLSHLPTRFCESKY